MKKDFLWRRKNRGRGKRRKIFGEGKYLFVKEKEKEESIWRRKIFFCVGE